MKKIMLFAGLMLGAALSLTNCAQEEISSPASKSGRTMTIGASLAPVKTTNDGLQTLWSANDNLTIFHAPAGTTAYVKDG